MTENIKYGILKYRYSMNDRESIFLTTYKNEHTMSSIFKVALVTINNLKLNLIFIKTLPCYVMILILINGGNNNEIFKKTSNNRYGVFTFI